VVIDLGVVRMYLEDIAAAVRKQIPPERLPAGDSTDLFLMYAVLARTKGLAITNSDVHDAWAAWIFKGDATHPALVEYEKLEAAVQQEDSEFAEAIRRAVVELQIRTPPRPAFSEVLFPFGPPRDRNESQQAFDLYKIMVQSSEGLVSRRQGVNTFFLTMNGVLLTGSGLVIQNSGALSVGAAGIAVLSLAGAILCGAWRSLITSFGQLNRGKFQVINAIEQYLQAAIYAAEWEALGRGEDPKVYRSFTSREIWVPNALLVLYVLTCITSAAVYMGLVHLRS
jgi:hypothetical protein